MKSLKAGRPLRRFLRKTSVRSMTRLAARKGSSGDFYPFVKWSELDTITHVVIVSGSRNIVLEDFLETIHSGSFVLWREN